MKGSVSRGQAGSGAGAPAPGMRRQHAQEIDLRAMRAVARASAEGREEGRREAALELAQAGVQRARRARSILILSVVAALLFGFAVGLVLGVKARTERSIDSHGEPR